MIATLRSDFWHRVDELPDLVALATDLGRLDVAAPSLTWNENESPPKNPAAGV